MLLTMREMMKKASQEALACIVVVLVLLCAGQAVAAVEYKDAGPYISVEKCRKLLKDLKKALLVDVRAKEQFESFRIPGSINIPLHFIKTRSFLKGRPVVLVNEGYRSGHLEARAAELKQEGFQLLILSGGLPAWNRSGGEITGNLFEAKQVNRISPQDCFLELKSNNHLVIDASADPAPESLSLIPGLLQVVSSDQKGGSSELVKAILTRNSVAPFSILMTNKDGQGYEKIEKALLAEGISNVFFLEGGLDGYSRFIQDVAMMRRSHVKQVSGGGCRTCPGFTQENSIATGQQ